MKSKFLLIGFLTTILLIGGSFSVRAADAYIENFEGYSNTAALQATWQETDAPVSGTSIARYLDTGNVPVSKVMRIAFSFPSGSKDAWGTVGRIGSWNWSGRTGITFWIKAETTGDTPQYYQVRFYESNDGDKWKSPLISISDLNPNGEYVTIPFTDFKWDGDLGGSGGNSKADKVMQLDSIVNLYVGAAYSGTATNGGTTTLWVDDFTVTGNVLLRNPYLQNVTQTSVKVMWGSSSLSGRLYWGNSSGTYPHSVSSTVFAANAPDDNVHTATISGLTPGEKVYYYVSSGGAIVGKNDPSYYATAAPSGNASFRFVDYGDTHYRPVAYLRIVQAAISHDPDIITCTGDISRNGQVWQYNDYFFNPGAPLIKNTPVFTSLGNHDLRWSGSIREYRDLLNLPTNSIDGTEDYYSFDYGMVHFVSLNTELLSGAPTPGYVNAFRAAAMKTWLKDDLAATKKPWKVVFFHRPTYLYDVDAAFRKIFEDYGVDLVFSGHIHTYDSHYRNGVTYITSGGANVKHEPSSAWPDYRIYGLKTFNFVVVDVTLNKLSLKAYNDYNFLFRNLDIISDAFIDDFESYADTTDLGNTWQWLYTPISGANINRYLETTGTNKLMRVEFNFPAGSTGAWGVVGRDGTWDWSAQAGIKFWIKAQTTGDTPQYYQVRFHEGNSGDKWKSPLLPISELDPNGQYATIPFSAFTDYGGSGGSKDNGIMELTNVSAIFVGSAHSGAAPNGGSTTLWVDDLEAYYTGSLSGTVTYNGYVGSSALFTFEFRKPGTTTIIADAAGDEDPGTPGTQVTVTMSGGTGTYSLSSIPEGTYDVTIKKLNTLREIQTNVSVVQESNTPNINFNLRGGDANADNSIGIGDMYLLRSNWGSGNGAADFNGDGNVGIGDMYILRDNWGETGVN